jgi:hypothetical protein
MKVTINNDTFEIKVASISTLLDIVTQIESRIPKGFVITEISLNEKILESNWYYNAKKIYLLDEDRINVKAEDPSQFSLEILKNSKEQFMMILSDFERIAESFRIDDEKKANQVFIQGIENLQWYFKILEDATQLLGKPLHTLTDNNISFKQYITDLEKKLDEIITLQSRQDWVMLADIIEYEMVPELRKIFRIYDILNL